MSYPKPTHPTLRGRWERLWSPGFGYCFRCGRSWSEAITHDTSFEKGHSCFSLCENCWSALTPEERIPYYDRLVELWIEQNPDNTVDYYRQRDLIRQAVMMGL